MHRTKTITALNIRHKLISWSGGRIRPPECTAQKPSRRPTLRHKLISWSGGRIRPPECASPVRYCFTVPKLSHYDSAGRARMVDVSHKTPSHREAEASAFVQMPRAVLSALPRNPKGDPLEVARIAGIMAAKRTADLIPMCHPLPLSHIDVELRLCENGVSISTRVSTTAETGVEMEALTAAAVSALTVYDQTKGMDKSIEIREIRLERKSGGKSGDYQRDVASSKSENGNSGSSARRGNARGK